MKRRDVFAEALALPKGARLELAAELLASVPPPGVLREEDPGLLDEIRRRLDQIESGEAKTVTWESVRAEALATVGRIRRARAAEPSARRPRSR